MKSIIYVKPMKETETINLTYLDYSIIYYDKQDNSLRLVIPDYNERFFDNNSIYKAMNNNISFFRNVSRCNTDSNDVIGLNVTDGVITDVVGICDYEKLKESLTIKGQVLSKRLK